MSQKTYLCTASHDIRQPNLPLATTPIVIEDQVWVGADAFEEMGVTVRQGVVVGARASVYKDVPALTAVGGNLARKLEDGVLQHDFQQGHSRHPHHEW